MVTKDYQSISSVLKVFSFLSQINSPVKGLRAESAQLADRVANRFAKSALLADRIAKQFTTLKQIADRLAEHFVLHIGFYF